MATIQIRDIPDDAYETIRQRAIAAGQSIQSYMRDQVIALATRRTKADVLAAVEAALAEYPPAEVTTERLGRARAGSPPRVHLPSYIANWNQAAVMK
jgi:plasmid stability protein